MGDETMKWVIGMPIIILMWVGAIWSVLMVVAFSYLMLCEWRKDAHTEGERDA